MYSVPLAATGCASAGALIDEMVESGREQINSVPEGRRSATESSEMGHGRQLAVMARVLTE